MAPELTEWAAFFAAGAGKRAAAEAGITRVISSREADDLLRDSEAFLRLVERTVHRSLSPPPAGDPLPGVAVVATATAVTRTPAGQARLSWGSSHVSEAPRAGVG